MVDAMSSVDSFTIPRLTGTHADVLAAVGLADLLSSAFDAPVHLKETPDAFVVHLPAPLTERELAQLATAPGYPFLKTNPKQQPPGRGEECVDYSQQRERARRYYELRASLQKDKAAAQDPVTQQQLQELQPRPDWRLLQVLNTLQGDENTNRLHGLLEDAQATREGLAQALAALREGRPAPLKWNLTSVQLFSPAAAKGYARLKPDGPGRNDKTKEQWLDPFLEWMKYRGYFRVACPYFQGSKSEHVRFFCPIPADISVRALTAVAQEVRRRPLSGGPPKMDALAVLHLAEVLIRHSQEYHTPEISPIEELFLDGRAPGDVVSGVSITYYQSLGQAKAVSAMSTLAVPGWFPVEDKASSDLWLAILDEHRKVVRSLRDDHSDEIGLLIDYRRFLERRGEGACLALLHFMGGYGIFVLRAREQKRLVASFSTDHLRRLVMALTPRYSEILDAPGFKAVATAVRRSTVSAQGQKAMGQQGYREIRYDLLPDLRRKRSLPGGQAFMEAVADFVASYNSENARRRETKRQAPRNVTTEEFAEFAALMEDHPASLIGALLCAYGSCREPYEPSDQAGEAEPGADAAEGSEATLAASGAE